MTALRALVRVGIGRARSVAVAAMVALAALVALGAAAALMILWLTPTIDINLSINPDAQPPRADPVSEAASAVPAPARPPPPAR